MSLARPSKLLMPSPNPWVFTMIFRRSSFWSASRRFGERAALRADARYTGLGGSPARYCRKATDSISACSDARITWCSVASPRSSIAQKRISLPPQGGGSGRGRLEAIKICPMAAHKRIYQFSEGSAKMRDLLGGKGAGAAEMTRAGMPVPPGFTITTEACREYYARGRKLPEGLWDQVIANLKTLERKAGKRFCDPTNPLLVTVRSPPKFSMPGMMDTVLNLGLNEETAKGLAALTKNDRFAPHSNRRFIQMFGKPLKGTWGYK